MSNNGDRAPMWRHPIEYDPSGEEASCEYLFRFRMPTAQEVAKGERLKARRDTEFAEDPAGFLLECVSFIKDFFQDIRWKDTGKVIEGGADVLDSGPFLLLAGGALDAILFRPSHTLALGREGFKRLEARWRSQLGDAQGQGSEVQGLPLDRERSEEGMPLCDECPPELCGEEDLSRLHEEGWTDTGVPEFTEPETTDERRDADRA